jgi:vesicle-associated membrane protein 7
MASIIYALVANDESFTPLAEVALAEGNFQLMAVKLLTKVEKNASRSFTYENKFTFHYHNQNGFTFLCMTDAGLANRTAYEFLFDINEKFFESYGAEARGAIGLSANREFGEVMKSRMEFFNTDPNADKLKAVRSNIEKTKDIMIENIDRVLARGEKIELLVKKTEHMSDSAVSLRKQAVKVKRHMWWKNVKLTLLVVAIVIGIAFFAVVMGCGGFSFQYCS